MNDKVYNILKNLSKDAVIGIMWDALSGMQGYNGQGMNEVIIKAMGGKILDNEDDECVKAKFPSVSKIEQHGKHSTLF